MPTDPTETHVQKIQLLEHNALVVCSCGFWVAVPRQFAEVALEELEQNGHPPIRRTA